MSVKLSCASFVLSALLAFPLASSAQLTAVSVVTGLSQPVGFVQDPSDPTRQFIVEKGGVIKVLSQGVLQATPFLNLSDASVLSSAGEQGLLGLAFPRDYATSRRFYVSFNNPSGHSVVSRFLRDPSNPNVADANSRFDFRWPGGQTWIQQPPFDQPVAFSNHKGGNIAFGPDGYLYFGLGDGGSADDPFNLAQNPQVLLGKMLRIDVNVSAADPEGYDVPPTNPFVGGGALPEIWALGLRNPWRWSFDYPGVGSTGALVIGDVGQGQREEIDYQPHGRARLNYGWRVREGTLSFNGNPPATVLPLREPLLDYARGEGRSITGGYVYRGQRLGAAFRGRYFFADFATSRVWSLGLNIDPDTYEASVVNVLEHSTEVGGGAINLSSFGVDAQGELYAVSYTRGEVFRFELPSPGPGTCQGVDPYAAVGGGQCVTGVWVSRQRGADLNGDHRSDFLFANTSKQLYAWFMNGRNRLGGNFLTPSQLTPTRDVVGISDLTGDGKADVVVQDSANGAVSVFIMNGTTQVSEQPLPIAVNTPWRVAGTGDFDGDGAADVLWRRFDTAQLYIWFLRPDGGGGVMFGGPSGAFRGGYLADAGGSQALLGATWRVVGTGDATGDAKSDIFFQNDSTGELAVWTIDGTVLTAARPLSPATVNPAWRVRAVADYNGDQHPDLAWEHATTGDLYIWFMMDRRLLSGAYVDPQRVNPIWQIAGPK